MLSLTKLICSDKADASTVESYKTLRTNIQFCSSAKTIKSILFTSSSPSEGKSTTASNLAISMAHSNKKILLVDADFRKSSLHEIFRIPNYQGLTSILGGICCYRDVIKHERIPNLDIITSGVKPPNPSELLGSHAMKAFMDEVVQQYDMVILDSPPIIPFTDAAILSRFVDGVVLIANCGKTTFDQALKAKEALKKVGAHIMGAVLNGIPSPKKDRYYYSYYDKDEKSKRVPKMKHSSITGKSAAEQS